MSYFNYHAKAKKLIKNGELDYYTICDEYNGIRPALVLFFKTNKPMPIRKERFGEYLPLLQNENYRKSR
ncbi:MAG: thermostable hemolysin delta-VPH [Christensenellales bacterium]